MICDQDLREVQPWRAAPSGSLGPAAYVKYEGERSMAVVWRLRYSLPGGLLASFAAAVA